MADFADDPRVKARGKIRRIIPANAELALTDDEWSAALEDADDPRVQQIVERLKALTLALHDPRAVSVALVSLEDIVSGIAFLLEDRKRLLGEVKRIESYCTEVEIARRVAESEVASLKAQIAAAALAPVEAVTLFAGLKRDVQAVMALAKKRCSLEDGDLADAITDAIFAAFKKNGLEVRALGAGEGERT